MNHSSGMYYEGLWVNGKPAVVSKRLIFKNPETIEIMQGTPFAIEVLCVDEDGELVEGRYWQGFNMYYCKGTNLYFLCIVCSIQNVFILLNSVRPHFFLFFGLRTP